MVASGLTCVGAISGAFGVKGEVRLRSFCAEPGAIAEYAPLATEDGKRSFDVTITRAINGGFAAFLSGVRTKEEADGLRGIRLYAPRERLPALPDDEYYHADLIGLDVLDTGGKLLGRVQAVHDHGAGDILEISGPGMKQSVMLPFTKTAVPTVDMATSRMIIDPPLGTFGEEADDQ